MVQIIPRARNSSDRFAEAFSNFGQTAAEKIPEEMMGRSERSQLSDLIGQDMSNIRNPDMQKIFAQMGMQQQKEAAKAKEQYEADQKNYEVVKDTFGKKFADIWLTAGQGERTLLTKSALEAKQRGINLEDMLSETGLAPDQGGEETFNFEEFFEQPQGEDADIQEAPQPEIKILNELKNHLSRQNQGLTPSEKVQRGKERYSEGHKVYKEAGEKLRGLRDDKDRMTIMKQLEKSGKLPKGLGRINVDKNGNLRVPFLANPETQRFIKILNEFSAGAKNTFGSRVTNFDLIQYMKRYPTLLNTPEGRKQILEQMNIVNDINSEYYKNLKNVFNAAGGVRNIDVDVAEKFAEQLAEDKIENLRKRFLEIDNPPLESENRDGRKSLKDIFG